MQHASTTCVPLSHAVLRQDKRKKKPGAVVKLRQASASSHKGKPRHRGKASASLMDPQRAVLEELKSATEQVRLDLELQLKTASIDRIISARKCCRDVSAMIRTRPIDQQSMDVQRKAYMMFRQSHWDCQKLHPGKSIVVFECFGRRMQIWRAYP